MRTISWTGLGGRPEPRPAAPYRVVHLPAALVEGLEAPLAVPRDVCRQRPHEALGGDARPRTAAALVASVDVAMFRSHDELASYCGIAPADSQSGTSARSTRPKRGGSKPLKNLLIFSCNSLIGTKNEFGRYYDERRGRGMRHNKALKAVARKRLEVIYAIMRDRVPYRAA